MTAYFFIALTIAFTVLGQYFQKRIAQQWSLGNAGSGEGRGWQLLLDRRVVAAVLCLGIAMLFWLLALQRLDVSVAYPLLAVNYVAMLLLARWRFHEHVPLVRWLGVLCIFAGIALITGCDS